MKNTNEYYTLYNDEEYIVNFVRNSSNVNLINENNSFFVDISDLTNLYQYTILTRYKGYEYYTECYNGKVILHSGYDPEAPNLLYGFKPVGPGEFIKEVNPNEVEITYQEKTYSNTYLATLISRSQKAR